MEFSDRTIHCNDCDTDFLFTRGEQEFFHDRGLTNAPKRCKPCREARRQNGGGSTANPIREEKQYYEVICDTCGIGCSVPFKPDDERPVYCRDCYRANQVTGRTA